MHNNNNSMPAKLINCRSGGDHVTTCALFLSVAVFKTFLEVVQKVFDTRCQHNNASVCVRECSVLWSAKTCNASDIGQFLFFRMNSKPCITFIFCIAWTQNHVWCDNTLRSTWCTLRSTWCIWCAKHAKTWGTYTQIPIYARIPWIGKTICTCAKWRGCGTKHANLYLPMFAHTFWQNKGDVEAAWLCHCISCMKMLLSTEWCYCPNTAGGNAHDV